MVAPAIIRSPNSGIGVNDDAVINIFGGTIETPVSADGNATLNIRGGTFFESIMSSVGLTTTINIYGGEFLESSGFPSLIISSEGAGVFNIFGENFNLPLGAVSPEGVDVLDSPETGMGVITGTFADQSAFSISYRYFGTPFYSGPSKIFFTKSLSPRLAGC